MDGLLGAWSQSLIIACRNIGTDGVEDHAAYLGVQADIIVPVVPRHDFSIHGILVEGLHELVGLYSFLGVNGYSFAILFDLLPTKTPDEAAQRVIGVFAVGIGDAKWMPGLFQLLADTPHVLPRVRQLFTNVGQQVRAHGDGERYVKPGDAPVLPI